MDVNYILLWSQLFIIYYFVVEASQIISIQAGYSVESEQDLLTSFAVRTVLLGWIVLKNTNDKISGGGRNTGCVIIAAACSTATIE